MRIRNCYVLCLNGMRMIPNLEPKPEYGNALISACCMFQLTNIGHAIDNGITHLGVGGVPAQVPGGRCGTVARRSAAGAGRGPDHNFLTNLTQRIKLGITVSCHNVEIAKPGSTAPTVRRVVSETSTSSDPSGV